MITNDFLQLYRPHFRLFPSKFSSDLLTAICQLCHENMQAINDGTCPRLSVGFFFYSRVWHIHGIWFSCFRCIEVTPCSIFKKCYSRLKGYARKRILFLLDCRSKRTFFVIELLSFSTLTLFISTLYEKMVSSVLNSLFSLLMEASGVGGFVQSIADAETIGYNVVVCENDSWIPAAVAA